MPNVVLQDLNSIIHGTSRHGLPYDVAHVTILLKTDAAITPDLKWSVPHIEDIPEKALNLLKDGTTPIYPVLKTKLRAEINDFFTNVDNNNTAGTLEDIEKALLLASMHETSIEPVDASANNNLYVVSYKYRLYPVAPNSFDFKVLLPFDGLGIANGGKLQVTVIAPIGAKINPALTNAKDFNGQVVAEEKINPIALVNKESASFEITHDPIFTITYSYQ